MAQRDVRAGSVAHRHHHGERTRAPFTSAIELPVARVERVRAAEARAPVHAYALAPGPQLETARGDGLRCGPQRELRHAIEILSFRLLEQRSGIPFDRSADLDARALRDFRRQATDAGAALRERTVKFLEAGAERRYDPDAGDCYAPGSHPARSGPAGGGERGGDVALEVGERLDAFQFLVGDADAEFLFDLEHELDEAQRVDAERVERRARVEPVGVDREFLGGKLLDAGKRVH